MSKVLLFVHSLQAGGAERVVTTLANEWSAEHDVTILAITDNECSYQINDKVNVIGMNIESAPSGIRRIMSIPKVQIKRYQVLIKILKQSKFDFCVSFCFIPNLLLSLATRQLHLKNTYVSERNDPYAYSRLTQWINSTVYRFARGIICQNEVVKEYYTDRGLKNSLFVLPNPVNFQDIPEEPVTQKRKCFVNVGRLVEQKDQKMLIEAFSEIADILPEYNLEIYGKGPLDTQLKELVKEKHLTHRVFLMGTKKRVMFEVAKDAVFVLSSHFEGFPNVLIEAMAARMPVISSKFTTGVWKDLITDGENGYLFEVGDKQQLKEAMKKMSAREQEHAEIGEINRAIALEYRDVVIAKKWMDTIAEKLSGKKCHE